MDKKIKFIMIKSQQIFTNIKVLEIKFDKGILINNFTIKSNKLFKFNLTINNYPIIDEYSDFNKEEILQSEYSSLDGYYYNFNFNNDILIENIKFLGYNDNINIYFEYDNTNLFNSSDDILNKYLDQYVFTKKYFKFNTNDIFDIKLNNIMKHKLIIKRNRSEKKIEFTKLDENIYKFKYLKNNTFYVEFDEIQYKKNDYIYNFSIKNNNYISSYYPIL
jgi:hypothetical protein